MRPLAVTTWVLFCAPLLLSAEQRINIRAVPGKNVTLPCEAGKEKEIWAVEWIRPDLVPDAVLLYRDGRVESDGLNPSFMNRVYLQDRQMKDGDASLFLKNVKIHDAGTYQCRVIQGRGNRRKRAAPETFIHLEVSPPGTQEGGGEEGGDEYGGPAGRGHLGLVPGLVSVLGIVAAVAAVLFLKRKKTPPPPEAATVQPLV